MIRKGKVNTENKMRKETMPTLPCSDFTKFRKIGLICIDALLGYLAIITPFGRVMQPVDFVVCGALADVLPSPDFCTYDTMR